MKYKFVLILTFFGLYSLSFQNGGDGSWTELKEGEKIEDYYRKDDKIFCGEVNCDVKPLENIDIGTFKVAQGTKYAKDDNHVYYPIQVICIDYTDCGVCYCDKYIVEGANSKTFKTLSKDYAADNKAAFFRGEMINKVDRQTFRVIEGPEFFYFAVDKNHVYI